MGAIYIDPVIKRATVDRNECVECYACFNGLSQEHLNPTVSIARKLFQLVRLRFIRTRRLPTAAFAPETSGRAWCAAHFRSARAAESTGARPGY
jgi:hypothetical protein